MDRRRLLKLGAAATTGLVLPAGTAAAAVWWLALPPPPSPALRPVSTDGGVDRYEIRQAAREVEILPGLRTRVWGYDGRFPGPTIEARTGRPVVVRHHNELPVPTVVHLHGGVTPAAHDGYPLDLILPAGSEPGCQGGTTTTGWTSPVRRSTAAWPAST